MMNVRLTRATRAAILVGSLHTFFGAYCGIDEYMKEKQDNQEGGLWVVRSGWTLPWERRPEWRPVTRDNATPAATMKIVPPTEEYRKGKCTPDLMMTFASAFQLHGPG